MRRTKHVWLVHDYDLNLLSVAGTKATAVRLAKEGLRTEHPDIIGAGRSHTNLDVIKRDDALVWVELRYIEELMGRRILKKQEVAY